MRRPLILTSIAAVAAASLLVAGCGGGSSTSSEPRSSANVSQIRAQFVAFAACMRSHGVAGYPEPKVSQSGNSVSARISPGGANPNSPAFKSAQKVCARYLPDGGADFQSAGDQRAHTEAMLAFARCVRSHGFPKFPDPTTQGRLNLSMITAAGIDLHQPAVLHAGLACIGVTHGDITRAAVEQAVDGTDGQGAQSSAGQSNQSAGG